MKQVILKLNIAFMVSLSLMMGACTDFPEDLAYDVKVSDTKIITPKYNINVSADGQTYGLEVSANIYTDFVNEEVKEAYIHAYSDSYPYWEKKVSVKSQLKSNGGNVTAYIDGIPFDCRINYEAIVRGNCCLQSSDNIYTDYIQSDKVGIKTGRVEPQASYAILHVECTKPQFLDERGYISIEIISDDDEFEDQKKQASKKISDYTFNVCGLNPYDKYRYRAIYIPPVGGPSYGEWHEISPKKLSSYEAVDLGLSVKWAAVNIGGSGSPGDHGDYYAWGSNVGGYYGKVYTWSSCVYVNRNSLGKLEIYKYCTDSSYGKVDNKTKLDLADDVAHVKWGGTWRMPTKSEFEELISNCDMIKAKRSGSYGIVVRSKKNGNGIFLPAASFKCEYDDMYKRYLDIEGYYWSSSLSSNSGAYCLEFDVDGRSPIWYLSGNSRYCGQCVRAVCP